MKIINIVGTRPNLIKIAPIINEMNKHDSIEHLLLHTGQHYDNSLSNIFFKEFDIPKPNINLNIGSDTQSKQVARIMSAFEDVCNEVKPDMILVIGDVNSTLACSLVAAKKRIKIIHVEAGIRSKDMSMPEEINRLVTDSITNYLLPPSIDAVKNLKNEGHSNDKICFVGNVMIDTLKKYQFKIQNSIILEKLSLQSKKYVILTLHRPSNVDNAINFKKILKALKEIQKHIKIIFPIHPRTKNMISYLQLEDKIKQLENLTLIEPLGYFDFGKLISNSKFVLTDSGGIQEETTMYGIPCITLRENTERYITVREGTNELVGMNTQKIISNTKLILSNKWKKGSIPDLWDGKTAERIVSFINSIK